MSFFKYVLALLVLIPTTTFSSASVVRFRSCTGTYCAPTPVVTTTIVAAPAAVVVPTYSAGHSGYDYNNLVVLPAIVNPDYYYSLQSYYRDKLLVDAIAGRVGDIVGRATATPAPRPPVMPPAVDPGVKPAPSPGAPGAALNKASEKLVKLVETNCLKCHSGATAAKGLSLDNLDVLPEVTRLKCYMLCNTGDMPKGGAAISDEDMKEFLAWSKVVTAASK